MCIFLSLIFLLCTNFILRSLFYIQSCNLHVLHTSREGWHSQAPKKYEVKLCMYCNMKVYVKFLLNYIAKIQFWHSCQKRPAWFIYGMADLLGWTWKQNVNFKMSISKYPNQKIAFWNLAGEKWHKRPVKFWRCHHSYSYYNLSTSNVIAHIKIA